MGTNYYLRRDVCRHCNQSAQPELHIGKSSGGWVFHFRGYPEDWNDPVIHSKADWEKVISNPAHEIYDEYGRHIDKTDFWFMVDLKQKPESMSPSKWIETPEAANSRWAYHNRRRHEEDDWEDPEGYSFTRGEFC